MESNGTGSADILRCYECGKEIKRDFWVRRYILGFDDLGRFRVILRAVCWDCASCMVDEHEHNGLLWRPRQLIGKYAKIISEDREIG